MSMVQSPEWIWKSVTLFFTSFSHLKDSGLLVNFHTNLVVEGEVATGVGPPAVPPVQHCSYQARLSAFSSGVSEGIYESVVQSHR